MKSDCSAYVAKVQFVVCWPSSLARALEAPELVAWVSVSLAGYSCGTAAEIPDWHKLLGAVSGSIQTLVHKTTNAQIPALGKDPGVA